MGNILSAIETALRESELKDAEAAFAAKRNAAPTAGGIPQRHLAELLAVELTSEERATYLAARRELVRIDGLLAKVAPRAAKTRLIDAKNRVAAGDTDPELVDSIGNLRLAKFNDQAQRNALKLARMKVEADFAKALLPVAQRAKAALDALLAEVTATEQSNAKRCGVNWVPSATVNAIRVAAEPTDRCVEIGRVSLEYTDAITTPEARGPETKPSKPAKA